MTPSDPSFDKIYIPPEALSALPLLRERLGIDLLAVYLHGSAVTSGLSQASDVDLIAISNEALPASTRQSLSADLLAISGHYPCDKFGRRPLEVIIFIRADLEAAHYPARAEFIYGEWLRDGIERGAIVTAEENPEYTLLLAQAREEATPLVGPDLTEFLPAIPFSIVRQAIADLLPGLIATVEGDERNVLLALARMWKTAKTGRFASKADAADWAAAHLSVQASAILKLARDAYLGRRIDDLNRRPAQLSQAINELRGAISSALKAAV